MLEIIQAHLSSLLLPWCCRPSSRCGGSSCRQRCLWACRRRRRRPPLWRSWSCTPRSSPLNRLQRRQRRRRRRRRRRHQHQHQHQRQWRQCNMAAATQHSQQQNQLARRLCLSLKQVPTTPKTPPATHDRRPWEGCCTWSTSSAGCPSFWRHILFVVASSHTTSSQHNTKTSSK